MPSGADPDASPNGCLGAIVRLVWMAFGNVALALVAVFIAQAGSFSRLDVVFWAVVGALVVARYVDVTRLNGLTADGQPASLGHWRRYSGALVVIAAATWGIAHVSSRVFWG